MEVVTGDIKVEVPVTRVKLDKSSIITSICIPQKKKKEPTKTHTPQTRQKQFHLFAKKFTLILQNNAIKMY